MKKQVRTASHLPACGSSSSVCSAPYISSKSPIRVFKCTTGYRDAKVERTSDQRKARSLGEIRGGDIWDLDSLEHGFAARHVGEGVDVGVYGVFLDRICPAALGAG